MSHSEPTFRLLSRRGVKFLAVEFIIIFLGVYLAFLFQNYSEQRKIDIEKEKILIGLKENLEYFRIFFPGFANNAQGNIDRWNSLIDDSNYVDFSNWRFIQPQ